MAATVLFPPATTTSGRAGGGGGAGALSHCAAFPSPRRRRGSRAVRAAVPQPERSSVSLSGDVVAKDALYRALEGVDRGIFGMTSAQRSEIHGLVELLESGNPTPEPTAMLQDKVDGCWKLIYSTISILGKKRTKLGLRDFISLGDFLQIIDVKKEKAVNVIKFSSRAFKILSGQLTIEASYTVTSKTLLFSEGGYQASEFNHHPGAADEYISEELRHAPGHIQPRGLARDNICRRIPTDWKMTRKTSLC